MRAVQISALAPFFAGVYSGPALDYAPDALTWVIAAFNG
jgi:hypothetical protein